MRFLCASSRSESRMHVRRPRECACSCFRCSCRHVAFRRHTPPTNPMFMPVYGNTHTHRDERRACSRGTARHRHQRMHRHRCESARTKKNRCADTTTRAKFRAMNTSPHALDATSTCASTQRARMTLVHDAMRACRWMTNRWNTRIAPCIDSPQVACRASCGAGCVDPTMARLPRIVESSFRMRDTATAA